jgi:hypothetical protein
MDSSGKELDKIMGKEELKKFTEKAYKLGFEYEKTYGGCAQSAIAAIQESLSIRDGGVFKAGTGLAGGGALTGMGIVGPMLLGLWSSVNFAAESDQILRILAE